MPTTFGSLRRLLLTPSLSDVTFRRRGFPAIPSKSTEHLEAIPQAVLCGFEWGIDAHDLWEVRCRLDMVEPELRGFAYEGATMACTLLDALGRGRRTRDLLRGPGQPHLLLAYIGIGFAMARLPRPLWKKVVPDLEDSMFHPTMSWLAVDGYGFDRAYFDTRRWVDEQRVPAAYPWQGAPGYFLRAVDQGIGRALWFIHGADASAVSAAVSRFAGARRADLWSGVGLAATFAGGCDADSLAWLRVDAGEHRAQLALGAVFAATARECAGFTPEHSELATATLTGLSVNDARALAAATAVHRTTDQATPPYELWRRGILAHFAGDSETVPRKRRAG
ncbi:DUF1702 family protein [Amycolatopsis anabasis]|uniref:DUF1702 family protein n=1 Tax=Amycolatopsis anabasis TaxID=1840409 RepID=UPI00131A9D3B|nr:DUF1702 family protein [Amycolatopsis anabasis]